MSDSNMRYIGIEDFEKNPQKYVFVYIPPNPGEKCLDAKLLKILDNSWTRNLRTIKARKKRKFRLKRK